MPFSDVVAAALLLREALGALDLESTVKTTGGEGLHVQVPIARRHTHEETRQFARMVAGALVRASGGLVTGERSPSRRHGVFVDTKMNGHGQQVVAPYSIRPAPGAPVATPVDWEEVDEDLDPTAFTPGPVRDRVDRGGDLAEALLHGSQTLASALKRI